MKRLLAIPLLIASFLVSPKVLSNETPSWYEDVDTRHMYRDAIYYMNQKGWVSGYEDNTFRPMNEINRVEALKLIMQLSDKEATTEVELDFPDLEEDAWYTSYIEDAVSLGIVSGNDDGEFKPESTVNRAEALKMLLLATNTELTESDSEEWYSAYLEYAIEKALIIPNNEGDYTPGKALTRGELSDIIYRFMKAPYTNEVEYGVASYYGWSFDGANTASGTALDAYGFQAAHKTIAFGTSVRVTNLDTQLSITVEIVDRGPYIEDRIIDLTPSAVEEIGSLGTGVYNVYIETLTE